MIFKMIMMVISSQVIYQLLPPTDSLASTLWMGAGVQIGSNNTISISSINVGATSEIQV